MMICSEKCKLTYLLFLFALFPVYIITLESICFYSSIAMNIYLNGFFFFSAVNDSQEKSLSE